MSASGKQSTFHFVMIKPSHYDDDGYVIQWARSYVPSNSLAAVYGLASDCVQRGVLGADVDIVLSSHDETNERIRVPKIVRMIKRSGGRALIGLVGVQSNQYPRALDISREFRRAGVPVCIGGFHVSGSLAMLPDLQPDLQQALDLGISLFAGEAEGRLERLFADALRGSMKPIYNYLDDLPGLQGAPVPYLPARQLRRIAGARAKGKTK